MVGHGGSSAGSYLADPTSPIPSHCASIVVTSTVRVNLIVSIFQRSQSNCQRMWVWRDTLRNRSICTLTALTDISTDYIRSRIIFAKFHLLVIHTVQNRDSHTFLIDNHVRLHSSQNASYTGDVCGLHLRLTAKPHICVIYGTFHTEVNTHLPLCSTHNLLIKR